ncbi:unnamed protein product [Diabrotica balteata]|nr:unnamed protein product [Diabrotica balteata]
MKSLQIAYQEEVVMLTGDDVLTPEYIQRLYQLDQEVRNTKSSKNLTLKDVCFMIPKVEPSLLKLLDYNDTRVDPSSQMNPALYCSFVESMRKECYVKSILDLWGFKKKTIMALTKEDIVNAINVESDELFGKLKSHKDLLGMVEKNETGHIVGAKALYNYWYLTKNFSAIDMEKVGNMAGTSDWATEEAVDWEGLFLEILEKFSQSKEMFYYAGRSFGDISNAALFQDMDLIVFGVTIMILYVQLVISKFNFVEMRIILGFIGLLSIGMSFVVGSGICSLIGVPYGPVHTSLPFLLMGLGVDDMFIIIACWEELTAEEKKLPMERKIALTLKHAGVSITITSVTDVIAFIIGSSTIAVIVISIICAGFSIESCMKLEKKFNPEWFIPEGTHLGNFFSARNTYFPLVGFDAGLYMGAVNYSHELTNIKRAVDKLNEISNTTENVVSWVDPFRDFVMFNFHHDVFIEPLDDDRFSIFLTKFLMSPKYAQYQGNFIFERELECGVPAPKIKLSTIDFFFKKSSETQQQISAMYQVRGIAENINFTSGDRFATVWSKFFATWITDELIGIEVLRNLQLALLCVMLCTIPLIANWQISCLIFCCVLITMVDVCGLMQRWGVNVDLVSCIGLELAIGLCVDYATHVGHTFLTVSEGNRQERVIKTVTSIGSAVLYGGLSTFIGVSMMSFSRAYTFQSFFKIFFLVIVFGLFHGIVLLPVILSFIGPSPYKKHKKPAVEESELKPLDS